MLAACAAPVAQVASRCIFDPTEGADFRFNWWEFVLEWCVFLWGGMNTIKISEGFPNCSLQFLNLSTKSGFSIKDSTIYNVHLFPWSLLYQENHMFFHQHSHVKIRCRGQACKKWGQWLAEVWYLVKGGKRLLLLMLLLLLLLMLMLLLMMLLLLLLMFLFLLLLLLLLLLMFLLLLLLWLLVVGCWLLLTMIMVIMNCVVCTVVDGEHDGDTTMAMMYDGHDYSLMLVLSSVSDRQLAWPHLLCCPHKNCHWVTEVLLTLQKTPQHNLFE